MRDVASTAADHPLLPLEARGLRLEANGHALVDLDLIVTDPGITVLMGPNGAGKSLALRLLHGLIAPTAGQVLWAGTPMTDALRRRQAMVFQKPVLLRRTVAQNLDFVLSGGDRADRRTALLDRVDLGAKAAQPARLLSGGEQQRLALARALATGPEVLFLDEPTASLDPASVLAIEKIVQDAARAGTKVIFVTHDVAQARRLADDAVLLHRGRVAEHAPAARFFDDPATPEARAWLAGRLLI